MNDYVCGGGDAEHVWIDHESVRAALHVPKDSYFYDSDGGGPYHGSEKNLMPFYQQDRPSRSLSRTRIPHPHPAPLSLYPAPLSRTPIPHPFLSIPHPFLAPLSRTPPPHVLLIATCSWFLLIVHR